MNDHLSVVVLEELLEEENDDVVEDDSVIFIALVISQWPFHLERTILHSNCLLQGGANYFFLNADSPSIERVTRLDRATFLFLLTKFEMAWPKSMERLQRTRGHITTRRLCPAAALGLVLYWLGSGDHHLAVALFSGLVCATVSSYLSFGLQNLHDVLLDLPETTISYPSDIYLQDVGQQCGVLYNPVMKGCCIVTDGSIHPLEKDEDAQMNFFYDEHHPDYNGWKGVYCKKGLYFFCLDGSIVWCVIDCPGSWHDGLLLDRAHGFVTSLPPGCWILGDTAFPRIPERLERVRKAGENLPSDRRRAEWQLSFEDYCSGIRIASEWGIKDLKRSWLILSRPLPSDNARRRRMTP